MFNFFFINIYFLEYLRLVKFTINYINLFAMKLYAEKEKTNCKKKKFYKVSFTYFTSRKKNRKKYVT